MNKLISISYKKIASVHRNVLAKKNNGGTTEAFSYLYEKTKSYLIFFLWFTLTIPFAFIIVAIRPIVKIYLVMLETSRIGHFAENTELALIRLNNIPPNKRELILYFQESVVCNQQLSRMWKRVLPILPLPFSKLYYEIDKRLIFLLGEKYRKHPAKIYNAAHFGKDTEGLLAIRKTPYIYFTRKEINQAEILLEKLGIPRGEKFVCLLVRDNNYLKIAIGGGVDYWSHHRVRDADINNYKKAALYLAENGYYVLRMGKHVKEPFIINHPKIIDYANHPLHCDLLDIYLTANCHFIISTSTGLDCISQLFRRPLLFTDVTPLTNQLQFWYPCVLFIPKKLHDAKRNKTLSFKEIEKAYTGVSMLEIQESLKKDNIEILPNTEDEILEAVCEMESRVNHQWIESEEDQHLHKRFLECYPAAMVKEKYELSKGSIKIKMGTAFTKNNIVLLE